MALDTDVLKIGGRCIPDEARDGEATGEAMRTRLLFLDDELLLRSDDDKV